MTIIYASVNTPEIRLKQYSKVGADSIRYREGHLNVWVFDDGEIHVDPINGRICEDGEVCADSFVLDIENAKVLREELTAAIETFEEEFAGEDFDEYAAARGRSSELQSLHAENGWDPEFPETSLVYDADGNCLGRLMSVDPESIRNNPSIQPWSKPSA